MTKGKKDFQMSNVIRYKMILFGNQGVGKTSLVERFINDKFEENYISTLGYTVYEKQFTFQNTIISLMIYDIGGQEKFRDLRKKYAEGADAAFIVYDITDSHSFQMVEDWKYDLYQFAGEIPFVIIGNKKDLEANRQVDLEIAQLSSNELGADDFFETSAKTGEEVNSAFKKLAFQTYEKKDY
ncbi:MAG: GTP-binding protein [Candidatus Lokiarchaeota archaeon]|nr:GTP-binding protein [Candidatus Lokiarchaeota archaeon]